MFEELKNEDEEIRRWAIINISKEKSKEALGLLLDCLHSETESNRRHVVRALGNIGGHDSIQKLLELIQTEKGNIMGDIAKSLGQLLVAEAKPMLEKLQFSDNQWIAQNSKWAMKQMENIL